MVFAAVLTGMEKWELREEKNIIVSMIAVTNRMFLGSEA